MSENTLICFGPSLGFKVLEEGMGFPAQMKIMMYMRGVVLVCSSKMFPSIFSLDCVRGNGTQRFMLGERPLSDCK